MDFASPAKAKLDSERVFAALIKKLRLRSKLGVYGRSIGGISACHLASKFKDLVQLVVIDRSLTELRSVWNGKVVGKSAACMYDLATDNCTCYNTSNFLANDCYKIVTCDPTDDTVDLFASIPVGVSQQLAENDYSHSDWRLLHESLMFIFNFERVLFN